LNNCICGFECESTQILNDHRLGCDEFLNSDEGHRIIEIRYFHDARSDNWSGFRFHPSLGDELSMYLLKLEQKSKQLLEQEASHHA